MKVTILYETVRSIDLDISEEIIQEYDFEAMWDEIHKADPTSNNAEEGTILAVLNADTGAEYYNG